MPKIIEEVKTTFITLNLSHKFIKEFSLIDIVNIPYDIYHAYTDHPGTFLYTYTPDIKVDNSDYKTYIELYQAIVKSAGLNEQQSDELLFLSKLYPMLAWKRENEIRFTEKYFKINGKLLVDLIKVPIKRYTMSEVFKAIKDDVIRYDPEILQEDAHWETDETLLTYLAIVTDKSPEVFKDVNGRLVIKKIDSDIADKIIQRYIMNNNYVIEDTTHKCQSIIFSNEINVIFSYPGKKGNKHAQPISAHFNKLAVTTLLQNLWDEQKDGNTDLYHALKQFDPLIDSDTNNLDDLVKAYEKKGYRTYVFKSFYDIISKYLDRHSILNESNTRHQKNRRKVFILKIMIFFGIIDHNAKTTSNVSLFGIEKELSLVKDVGFRSEIFNDIFTNLKKKVRKKKV